MALRRGAGAVERGGLENRWARERPLGSNPSPAASPEPSGASVLEHAPQRLVEKEEAHELDLRLRREERLDRADGDGRGLLRRVAVDPAGDRREAHAATAELGG